MHSKYEMQNLLLLKNEEIFQKQEKRHVNWKLNELKLCLSSRFYVVFYLQYLPYEMKFS